MRIETNATDRRALVQAISDHLGQQAAYQGPPTFAYAVGAITVERDSSLTGNDADLEALKPFLREQGYLTADRVYINLPLAEFTPLTLTNMLRMLYARQYLIREMAHSDTPVIDEAVITRLKEEQLDTLDGIGQLLMDSAAIGTTKGIEIAGGKLNVAFPQNPEQPTEWTSYATLLFAIANRAKQAHHVSAELLQPEDSEMKYFARCWLMQLGLGGAEHKDLRGILLNHLHGYAAFRSADQMQKHQEKYAALRRQQREETQQPAADLEAQAEPDTTAEAVKEEAAE